MHGRPNLALALSGALMLMTATAFDVGAAAANTTAPRVRIEPAARERRVGGERERRVDEPGIGTGLADRGHGRDRQVRRVGLPIGHESRA